MMTMREPYNILFSRSLLIRAGSTKSAAVLTQSYPLVKGPVPQSHANALGDGVARLGAR